MGSSKGWPRWTAARGQEARSGEPPIPVWLPREPIGATDESIGARDLPDLGGLVTTQRRTGSCRGGRGGGGGDSRMIRLGLGGGGGGVGGGAGGGGLSAMDVSSHQAGGTSNALAAKMMAIVREANPATTTSARHFKALS